MANAVIPVNPATNPPILNMDVEAVTPPAPAPPPGPNDVLRERIEICGASFDEIARVIAADPTWAEFALVVRPIPPRTSTAPTITNVPASLANVQLLAANAARKQACFTNDPGATGTLYLKLGAGAANNSYTVIIRPGGYYELPQPVYTGEIDGFWDDTAKPNGALITEIT